MQPLYFWYFAIINYELRSDKHIYIFLWWPSISSKGRAFLLNSCGVYADICRSLSMGNHGNVTLARSVFECIQQVFYSDLHCQSSWPLPLVACEQKGNPKSWNPELEIGIRNQENKMGKTKESKFFQSEIKHCIVCSWYKKCSTQ